MIRLQRVKIIFMFTALIFFPCHTHVLHAVQCFYYDRYSYTYVSVCLWQRGTCKNSILFAWSAALVLALLRTLLWRCAGGGVGCCCYKWALSTYLTRCLRKQVKNVEQRIFWQRIGHYGTNKYLRFMKYYTNFVLKVTRGEESNTFTDLRKLYTSTIYEINVANTSTNRLTRWLKVWDPRFFNLVTQNQVSWK